MYGTDEETEEDLKDPERNGCYLRAEPGDNGEFLPLTTVADPPLDPNGTFFIVGGDFRVEEQAILTAMHTVCAYTVFFSVRSFTLNKSEARTLLRSAIWHIRATLLGCRCG